MKIKISQIDDSAYTVRESINGEALKELKDSLSEDGQWDAIIVRPKGDVFELISGHRRVQAAKELGWTEIEATIKDLSDVEALFLALKTNLLREEMSEREQGKVLHQISQEYDLTPKELAQKIGKSKEWVSGRIRVAMDLHPEVAKALDEGKIGVRVAEIIGSLTPEDRQLQFLKFLNDNGLKEYNEVRKVKKYFLNDKIYTIGYEGRSIEEFVEVLKANEIETLLDIRFSVESSFKPEFSKNILSRELERAKIKYVHKKELGVPFEWQNPYKEGGIPFDCFEKYYRWHLLKEVQFADVVKEIKDSGKTALMCYERYAVAQRNQKISCHRSILATRLKETGEFKEIIHL